MKVLFVCLGNICRSPAAEGVFLHQLEQADLLKKYTVDSAGTSAHHAGEWADQRMRSHAQARGIELKSISRQFIESDFDNFDLIVVMDDQNYKNCASLAHNDEHLSKLVRMTDFTPSFSEKEVPDPYYGGAAGFDHVLDMVEEGCSNLIKKCEQA